MSVRFRLEMDCVASDTESESGTSIVKDRIAYKMAVLSYFSAGSLGDIIKATSRDVNRNTLAAIQQPFR